jgi:hypothetical protein
MKANLQPWDLSRLGGNGRAAQLYDTALSDFERLVSRTKVETETLSVVESDLKLKHVGRPGLDTGRLECDRLKICLTMDFHSIDEVGN